MMRKHLKKTFITYRYCGACLDFNPNTKSQCSLSNPKYMEPK